MVIISIQCTGVIKSQRQIKNQDFLKTIFFFMKQCENYQSKYMIISITFFD
jgi:hypothetical protein